MTAPKLREGLMSVQPLLEVAKGMGAKETGIVLDLHGKVLSCTDLELTRISDRWDLVRVMLGLSLPPTAEALRAMCLPKSPSWPLPTTVPSLKGGNDWAARLFANEVGAWKKVGIVLPNELQDLYIATLEDRSKELVERDLGYGFAYCALPAVIWTKDSFPKKWVKPGDWYWNALAAGHFQWPGGAKIDQCALTPGVCLADVRQKPAYADGHQRWLEDVLMEAIIGFAQESGQFPDRDPKWGGSRFFLSRCDYEGIIAPLYRQALGLPLETVVRLETVPEWSALCQYKSGENWQRAKDGKTNTWVWFHEYYDSSDRSLDGGYSDSGGLAYVDYNASGGRGLDSSARLLAVLGALDSGP